MAPHLTATPSAAFWLDRLSLPEFEDAAPLLADPDALAARLAEEFAGPGPRRVMEAILAEVGDSDEVRANLLLVAWFLKKKKGSAVQDVATTALHPDVVAEHSNVGRVHRLPLAALLYRADPAHLLAVDICHRWHSRRRCALELVGPRRKLPAPTRDLDWTLLAGQAVASAVQRHPRHRGRLTFRGHILRRRDGEVLLAWSEPAGRDTVRNADGGVVAGRHDDWTILRVHRQGNRVDVTATRLDLGFAIADGLATAIWKQPHRYRRARNPLTGEGLNEFLRRLRSPDDDTFRLLEIAAEVPGLPDRPLFVVTNAGQARVETAVEELRRHMAFAERWQTVHRVKVGFGQHHRIEVHFPTPDEDLVLTYSDAERDKEISSQFESLLADELGVEVHPKVARRGRSRQREVAAAPAKPGRATWERLLSSVLDDPAPWEEAALAKLSADGVVEVQERTFFRCGDGPLSPGRPDTVDCPGEIEMPYGGADPNDRLRQEDDAEFTCGVCGTAWYPGRYRLPVVRRLRVRVDTLGAWRRTLEAACELGAFADEAPGVASGFVKGVRVYLVSLPLASPAPWHQPALAATHPTCWASQHGDPRLVRFAARGIDLADVLADGRVALARVFDLGREAPGPAPLLTAAEPPPSPYAPVAPTPSLTTALTPSRRILVLDDRGVWFEGTRLAPSKATGTRTLFSLLWEGAQRDQGQGKPRALRTAEELVRMTRAPGFQYTDVQTWVSRTRGFIDKRLPGGAALSELIIEGGKGSGYRLGPGFECVGFDLTAELAKRQRREAKT